MEENVLVFKNVMYRAAGTYRIDKSFADTQIWGEVRGGKRRMIPSVSKNVMRLIQELQTKKPSPVIPEFECFEFGKHRHWSVDDGLKWRFKCKYENCPTSLLVVINESKSTLQLSFHDIPCRHLKGDAVIQTNVNVQQSVHSVVSASIVVNQPPSLVSKFSAAGMSGKNMVQANFAVK